LSRLAASMEHPFPDFHPEQLRPPNKKARPPERPGLRCTT
jgi:hypothetical protein